MPDLILNYNDVRFDEQGKPYWVTQSGKKSYLPPASAAQSPNARARAWAASQGEVLSRDANGVATGVVSNAAPTGGYVKSRGVWNPNTGQFDQGLNPGGLLGTLEGAAAVAGPAVVGPMLTGSPTIFGAAAPGATAPAAPVGTVGGEAGAMTGATSAGAGTAAKGFTDRLKDAVTNPGNLASLAGLVTSLAGGGGGSNSANTDELRRIQAITEQRMRRVDPLHQAITSLAMSRLPTNMQRPVPDLPLPPSGVTNG